MGKLVETHQVSLRVGYRSRLGENTCRVAVVAQLKRTATIHHVVYIASLLRHGRYQNQNQWAMELLCDALYLTNKRARTHTSIKRAIRL